MLKCGQKDNKKYTFGLRKEQMQDGEVAKEAMITIYCSACSRACKKDSNYCPHCGEKL